jgi:glycosyltransferase involved in cell wall biosynthesis
MKNKTLEEFNPKVSIGLIVYNGGEYLRGAIDSFLAQTFDDYEIIISDNASTDDTQIICEEYAALNHKIRYIRQVENQGPIFNFKYALSQAKGDYFMWASHDDIFAPTYISECLNAYKNNPECISVCSNFNVTDLKLNQIVEKISPVTRTSSSIFVRAIISLLDMHPNMIYGLHKTEIIRKVKFDTFDWFDVFINIQLSYYGKIFIIPEYLYVVGTDGPRKPYSMTGKYFSFKTFRQNLIKFNKDKFTFLQRTTIVLYVFYITMKNKRSLNKVIFNWDNS